MEYDLQVTNGSYACIKKLVSSKDEPQNFLAKLPLYKSECELFSDDFAKESKKTTIVGETLKDFLNYVKI